jgi:putative ABC transport system substrate-binding protein
MAIHIRRRDFIGALGGAAAWPLAAHAQQPAMPIIGFLNSGSADPFGARVRAFHHGLNQTGYIESRNAVIEFRWAEGNYDRLPEMAADLVGRQVAVIAASATPAAIAAKAATSTIPIVFSIGGDPVRFGLVASFARPNGNATGIHFFTNDVTQKRFRLIHELMPKGAMIGLLVHPESPNTEVDTKDAQAAAEELGHKLVIVNASTGPEIDAAFAQLVQLQVGGLVVQAEALFTMRRGQIATLAARHAIPAISADREFVMVGGLMSYASNLVDAYREMGTYAGRILKGAKPADLPVIQPAKLDFVINLTTAKAIGLTIPPGVLAIADEVVE